MPPILTIKRGWGGSNVVCYYWYVQCIGLYFTDIPQHIGTAIKWWREFRNNTFIVKNLYSYNTYLSISLLVFMIKCHVFKIEIWKCMFLSTHKVHMYFLTLLTLSISNEWEL